MYKFKPATDRIWHMRNLIRDRCIRMDASLLETFTEADQKFQHMMPILKKSSISLYVAQRMEVSIEDFELIVGSKGKYFCGRTVDPRSSGIPFALEEVESGRWTLREDGLYHTPESEEIQMCIAPEDVELLKKYASYWKVTGIGAAAQASAPEGYEEFRKLNASDYGELPILMISAGHLIAGYKKIVNVGYGAIRKVADDWLDARKGNLMGEDAYKYPFYRAASLMCQAASELCLRYAEAAERKIQETADEARRAELEMMHKSLLWISENPARTFYEAVQLYMMYQTFLHLFDAYPAMALGRFDQITWPYLKKELEEGTITEEYAQEIVDAFFLKANCFYMGGKGRLAQTTGIGNTYQHTTLGGVDPVTGEDATNPVTYMALETVGRLLLHDPTISLRINKNTPDKLWDCALETSKLVGGLPLFQNDEVITPSLMRDLGWDIEDARDYGIIGCQEIVGCGNDYPAGNGMPAPHASIHYGVALAMALNDGKNPFNGEQCPIHTGYLYEMNSIEEVHEAYRKITEYVFNWHVTLNNYTEMFLPYFMPQPGLSISVDGCMESGKDIVAGGAKHNSYGGTATGLATIADSFTTIKYMCFDKKLCTTRELYDAVMANWEGYEPLRQQIKNEVPHFGNGDPYADMEMKFCIDTYIDQCSKVYSVRAPYYKPGLYGAADHIAQGYHTWATPDGRKTGEPIADAASPVQSHDKFGPTAIFNSSLVYDQSKMLDGIALNLRMHPSALANQEGIDKLRDMSKIYFEQGGLEVQYNVVDTETLRKAQKDPGEYRDLVVRIAGYSAYFVELGTDLQNDIIARNENML
ncbi:MAG: hypothetical protein IKK00_02690 [Oscillospiraceae bacterium]|nr:hypothetical protein [Oscillospiraceae bacterium]MBR4057030.1 hypothetical protein [Oscillospiraceae bacterium]